MQPPNQSSDIFTVILGNAQGGKNLSHPPHIFPAEVKQGNTLPSCFNSYCKQCPFGGLVSAAFLCFLL